MAPLQEVLDRASRLRELDGKSLVHLLPERLENLDGQVLRARHRGRCQGQRLQLPYGWCRNMSLRGICREVRERAEGRHIPRAKFSPVREYRRKRDADLARPKLKKAVTRASRESIFKAPGETGIQGGPLV